MPCLDRGRAAINAILEVTLPMETAGLAIINRYGWQHNDKVPLYPATEIFNAMIGAVLR